MKTIRIGTVSARMPAVIGSTVAVQTSTASGTTRGQHELGQVAGEVGLERVDALDGGGGQLAGALAGGAAAGAHQQQLADKAAAQLGHHPRGAEPPGELEAAVDERPREQHGGERERAAGSRADDGGVVHRGAAMMYASSAAWATISAGAERRRAAPASASCVRAARLSRSRRRSTGEAIGQAGAGGSAAWREAWSSARAVAAAGARYRQPILLSTAIGVSVPSKSSRPRRWRKTQ